MELMFFEKNNCIAMAVEWSTSEAKSLGTYHTFWSVYRHGKETLRNAEPVSKNLPSGVL